jgi:tryptophanyl-tRNA synthetase
VNEEITGNKRILSGVRATGGLHLGNYIGAIAQWKAYVDREPDAEFLFFVADMHAITTKYDTDELFNGTREIAAAYMAAGIDVNKITLFPQSAVPQHAQLQWLFSGVTPLGWLNRMTQFKEKAGKKRDEASLGLYAYPALMAADILLYDASHVPVGEDQKQHVELTREIASAFNHRFDREVFRLPAPEILAEGARVMSLRDGSEKMSKSAASDMARINLRDDADTIARKIKKARTDAYPVPESREDMQARPEAHNLITIFAALKGCKRDDIVAEYGGQQFSDFKQDLSEVVVETMAPITAEMDRLMRDPDQIDRILSAGAERARERAAPKLEEAKRVMGFWHM